MKPRFATRLVWLILIVVSCASPRDSVIRTLDSQEFTTKFGAEHSDWRETDKQQLPSAAVATCFADLRSGGSKARFTFAKLYAHPKVDVLFAVFDTDDIDDFQVTYVFDRRQNKFVGKLWTGGA